MAVTYNLKRSSTASAVPPTLTAGEPAVNLADNRLFFGTGSAVQEFLPDINRLPGVDATVYPSIRPSLNLNFSEYTAADPQIAFTRSSIGTYVSSTGHLTTVLANVPRIDYNLISGECNGLLIEEQRTNLLTYSSQFNKWSLAGISIISQPSLFFQTMPMWQLTATIANYPRVIQAVSLQAAAYALTFYVSRGTTPYLEGAIEVLNTNTLRFFADLNAGVASTTTSYGTITGSASLTLVSSGIFRLTVIANIPTAASYNVFIGPASAYQSSTANIGDYIYASAAQMELGTFPTSYIPSNDTFTSRSSTATYFDSTGTLQTASSNVARYDYGYVNGQWVSKGLLLENQATNLLTYSEQFDNANWQAIRSTVANDATLSPSGAVTADKLIETTDSGAHYLYRAVSVTSGFSYTISCYAKAAERTTFWMQFYNTNNAFVTTFAYFDLTSGTIQNTANTPNATIVDVGNGWYRCSITTTATATVTGNIQVAGLLQSGNTVYTGDGTSGLYIWGAQLEATSFPTSYIPTTSAQVTRAVDVSSSSRVTRARDIASVQISSNWYNYTEGTLVTEAIAPTVTQSFARVASIENSTQIILSIQRNGSGNNARGFGVNFSLDGGSNSFPSLVSTKVGMSATTNNATLSVNGIISSQDTSGQMYPPTALYIGSATNGTANFNGWIRNIAYYPKKLTDAELASLTKTG